MSGPDATAEMRVGACARLSVEITEEAMDLFIQMSGDTNPLHKDVEVARRHGFPRCVAPGALLVAYLSQLIGVRMPGAGAVWKTQTCSWLGPVFPGDRLDIESEITRISPGTGILTLRCTADNQLGNRVFQGEGEVLYQSESSIMGSDSSVSSESSIPTDVRVTRSRQSVGQGATLLTGASARRVALVTGGGRGIGAAIAAEFARRSIDVALTYRTDPESAQSVADQLQQEYGIQSCCFPLDLFSEGSVKSLVPAVSDKLGKGVDILVNSAGPVLKLVKAEAVNRSHLRHYWTAFVESTLELIQAGLPAMKEQSWGRIINLGTGALGGAPPSQFTPYLCAKMALLGLTRSLAVELGPFGITVNMVSPGMTVTDFSREIPQRTKMAEAQRNPCRRLATPEDTARTTAFLASGDADYINGVNLFVTGGNPL